MASRSRVAVGRIGALNAHTCHREGWDVREHFLLQLLTKSVGFGYGQRFVDKDGHVGVEPVAQPTRFDIEDFFYPRDMLSGMTDFADHRRLHPVEHTGEHGLGGLPDDAKDGDGNEKTDDRIGKGEA